MQTDDNKIWLNFMESASDARMAFSVAAPDSAGPIISHKDPQAGETFEVDATINFRISDMSTSSAKVVACPKSMGCWRDLLAMILAMTLPSLKKGQYE